MKVAGKEVRLCLSPAEIEERLLQNGVQPTAQRIAICRYVLCEADHPTAEEVKAWADANFPKMSLATVYNTLNTLVAVGLLREFRFPHSEKVIYDSNMADHYHFLDEETGELFDVNQNEVEVQPKLKGRFHIHGMDLLIRGKRGS
jgi:Fur family iron response transcriptional regulator